MYKDYFVGFLFGMVAMLVLMIILELSYKEDKKEPDYWVNKHVIHEERLHTVPVTVAVDVPNEELVAFSSDEYKKHVITGKLKLKLIDKLWEFVKFEKEYNPMSFEHRYYAKILVLLPTRQALKVEVEKETF